MSRTSA
ncbi:1b8c87cb-f24a-4de1-a647-aa25294aec87 [Thermothielavioides terrestris]|nr:1b8c87cb-f24a-4de1-a647-aa25294aec87 [Thermothielavioides terrestris]